MHQAAVLALTSIRAVARQQQKVDSMLRYLDRHAKQVESIDLTGDYTVSLRQLSPNLQLGGLQLGGLCLLLQPSNGFAGVLSDAAAIAALKQLQLRDCYMLDDGLLAALCLLQAGLEHLTIHHLTSGGKLVHFPTAVLHQLQQLTYLELAHVKLQGPVAASPALQPLQALTSLVDLRLEGNGGAEIVLADGMLSGADRLTHLHVHGMSVMPGVLDGKTQLQHLKLAACSVSGGAVGGVAQLMFHLHPLQQLTHLDLAASLEQGGHQSPPAEAYAALTASTKLRHLNISNSMLPAGVWQQVFPVGRQLPYLTSLSIANIMQPSGGRASVPEGNRLASCCPNLQCLDVRWLQRCTELLPALQGLSTLHSLSLAVAANQHEFEGMQQLLQLRHLTELSLRAGRAISCWTCLVS
jgi:hypothetical protein